MKRSATSEKGIETYLAAATRCPDIIDHTDLMQRVPALEASTREDRRVQVTYLDGPGEKPLIASHLATDGQQLYLAATANCFDSTPLVGAGRSYSGIMGPLPALAFANRQLWSGTEKEGIWRCDASGTNWSSIRTEQGLPDLHIQSITAGNGDTYAGVGTKAAGGLVRSTRMTMCTSMRMLRHPAWGKHPCGAYQYVLVGDH